MTTHPQFRDQAEECARAAADRLGLRIVELTDAPSHHVASALLQRVWKADTPDAVAGASLMTALACAGNYVVGAYQGEEMVAAAVGFFGVNQLHSHITGVNRSLAARGVGFAVKQHQRAWALARGIQRVCWTFDPLVGRNAYFNLHKLGASAVEYLPDFYGELADGINGNDPTDRLYVRWELESPAAVAAAAGQPVELDAARFAGAIALVDRGDTDTDISTSGDVAAEDALGGELAGDRRPVLIAVPRDVEALRVSDPAAAATWRYAVRRAMRSALAAGYHIDGISRDGFYALSVPSAS